MKRQTFTIEIITPCFCGGADASVAEIRAPSIRGQLRWWFRALGGTKAEEEQIFGTVAGDDSSASSKVKITISNYTRGDTWTPPKIDPNIPQNYIWHFASVSGKPSNAGPRVLGPRWQDKGLVPPGSQFDLGVTLMRSLPPNLYTKFRLALHAFLAFGTLGLRATRGLGAFNCTPAKQLKELIGPLENAGFVVAQRIEPDSFGSWEAALKDWSSWLRYKFRKDYKAARFSALGGIQPRQASAVRFRPIKLATGQYTWLALEAPHGRILNQSAPKILSPGILTGPAPQPPSTRR